MSVFFHEQADEHAPHPHRVVILTTASKTNPQTVTMVICANCDHWIVRDSPECVCEWDCHEIARSVMRL